LIGKSVALDNGVVVPVVGALVIVVDGAVEDAKAVVEWAICVGANGIVDGGPGTRLGVVWILRTGVDILAVGDVSVTCDGVKVGL
jgi:hypothetical protein